jgi:hypothetical protein
MSNGAIYEDGNFTVALRVTLPVLTAPIPGVNKKYVLTEDWVQYAANYSPLAFGTAYPSTASGGDDAYTSYQIVSESGFINLGNGVVRWTRKYALVPDTHYDPVQVSYQFIGLATFDPLETVIRPPFTRTVPGVVEYRYFDAGTNSYSAMQSVQKSNFVPEQLYYWPRSLGFPAPVEALKVDTLWEATVPAAGTYASWVSNGTTTIVAQPSYFERWEGNIIKRTVVTVLAQ